MRFRINKNNDGSTYSIVVFGTMDKAGCGDILEIAQTILMRPLCTELMLDLRSTLFHEDLPVFDTDALTSIFEEGLLGKNSTLIVRYRNDNEIRFSSDQLPLHRSAPITTAQSNEAEFFGKMMKWLDKEAQFLIN